MIKDEITDLTIRLIASIDDNSTQPQIFARLSVSYAWLSRMLYKLEKRGYITKNKIGRTNYFHLIQPQGYRLKSVCSNLISLWEQQK